MTLSALRRACGPWSLFIVVAALLLLSSSASIAFAENGPARLRVAVLDFDVNDLTGDVHEPERHGRFMANAFEASLVQSRRFTVLTRLDLEKVLDEQALDVSGVVNPEQARAFGVAGVDVIITGSITVLGEASFAVLARYIDVVTGEVFDAEHVQTSGPDGFIGIATQLVERVAARLPLQGHVIGEEDDGVVIDIGMEHGLVGPGEMGGVYRVRSMAGRRGLQAIGTFVVRYAFQDVALVDVELADGEAVEPGDVVIVGASGLPHPSSEDPSLARAPSTGTVRIEGGPVGAEVTAGDAPPVALPREGVELQLPTGVQRLRVTAEGYLPLERLVAVEPDGVALVEVHLAPRPGSISFLVEPSAAMVFVNGSMVGSGSVVVDGLAAGPVRYRVEARGFDPHEGLVTVPPGGLVERQVRLQPLHDDAATPDIATIAGGGSHSALLDDGTIWTWGSNASGRLGDGTTTNRTTPTRITTPSGFRTLGKPHHHLHRAIVDGASWSWCVTGCDRLPHSIAVFHWRLVQVRTNTVPSKYRASLHHVQV